MYWISAIFVLVALGFSGYGINLMYDDSYGNQVVGGDAYNFIIYATRGTAYVCTGIVFAIVSVTVALVANRASPQLTISPIPPETKDEV